MSDPAVRPSTADPSYAARLQRLESARWKRWLDVQAPYRWNVRRLCPGRVLDLGCGVGRNLAHLDGRGLGVDHSAHAVAAARARGLTAVTSDELWSSEHARPQGFDTLLAAHLLEHLPTDEALSLLAQHLPLVRPGGLVVLITPQERGWRSDATHVRRVGPAELAATTHVLGLEPVEMRSFPFPRAAGRVFTYNEHVHVARVPAAS